MNRADTGRRWPLSRIVTVAVLALLLFSVAAVVVGAIALASPHKASTGLDDVLVGITIGLLLTVVLLALILRAAAIRLLHRLADQVRQVADGDFDHEVTVRGSREVTQLAADVNTMRERILRELSATRQANAILQAHTTELQRSNSELEQFAYVASQDLQEPLRKVASFSQLLQRRPGPPCIWRRGTHTRLTTPCTWAGSKASPFRNRRSRTGMSLCVLRSPGESGSAVPGSYLSRCHRSCGSSTG